MQTVAVLGSLAGAGAMLAWRVRETQTPVTAKKLLAPPLGMSTGFSMFLYSPMRIPWSWGLGAFLLGSLVFAYPLALTSKLVRRGDDILLERSKAFLWILLGLVAARLALRSYLEQLVSPMQTAALVFVLAFGMLLPWRINLLVTYRKMTSAG